MTCREQALRAFAERELRLGTGEGRWQPVTGDASSRRYFRLTVAERSWICADAPPESEKNDAFVAVHALLWRQGLPVPALSALDLQRGFLVLEDFGDDHLLDALDTRQPPADYRGALPLLLRLQAVDPGSLPMYSRAVLGEEFGRFYDWFCRGWLDLPHRSEDVERVAAFGERLIAAAEQQPTVFVFRDYHSRNLLLRSDGTLGLIDFQDAVRGPLCYDLASLLKDCYIRWPRAQVRRWALDFRQGLLREGRSAGVDDEEFLRWFDWIGLHRHIKVLGNFTRLALRDGKRGYLEDIPLVLAYVDETLAAYSEFEAFRNWFQSELGPRIARQDWSSGA
jgi:aminoglycoside/choline kinase family phosphotransferase